MIQRIFRSCWPRASLRRRRRFAEEAPVELSIVTVRRTTDITESYSQKVWVQEWKKR